MKGVFKGILQKTGKSYKFLFILVGMIETLAASHMILKVLLNGT
jgi:hypothetical protein